MKIIVYSAWDEVIVTTEEDEEKTIKDYFSDPKNRDIAEYDRQCYGTGVVCISSTVRVR